MFKNVGSKIQDIAYIYAIIGIAASLIGGIIYMIIFHKTLLLMLLGIIIMIVGSIVSWIVSLFIYGFGLIVENSENQVKQNESTSFEK
jgi:hypothetical protein